MNLDDIYQSKYIKAADLNGRGRILTIKRTEMEEISMETGEQKPVIYFGEAVKGLVLNKTNAESIALGYGRDTDDWIGKELEVYPTTTPFRGQIKPCIRVKLPPAISATSQASAPPRSPSAAMAKSSDFDDDIPF